MIKKERKKRRLTDLLGVLLVLVEKSENEDEREFFDGFAKETEQKIKEIDK